LQQKTASLDETRQGVQAELRRAVEALQAYEARPHEYFRVGLGLSVLLLLFVAAALLATGVLRLARRAPATASFAGAFACLVLCLIGTTLLSRGLIVEGTGPPVATPLQQ